MRKEHLLARILQKVAPRIGARVFIEPVWGVVGQIVFKSGRRRYFRSSTIDLNRMGASEIARDKDYAKLFMARMGYPVIEGKAFCSPAWATAIHSRESAVAAYRYARKLGWPVIVKPNSKSQGRGVFKAHTRREFEAAFKAVSKIDHMVLVERFIAGRDYRLVVLDGGVISAYERMPLSVTGDGRTTVRGLLVRKQRYFERVGRDTVLRIGDRRIADKLRRQGLSLASRIEKGRTVYLLDNANLSSGGDSRDVTAAVHPSFRDLAARVTKDMGLRLCGVDLMVDGDISQAPRKGHHWIIEINSAPGLDHYATIGAAQQKIVEDLYLEVLRAMDTDE